MNDKIKLTKLEVEILLDRPFDCIWDSMTIPPFGSGELRKGHWHDDNLGWSQDQIEVAAGKMISYLEKNKAIPENIDMLEAYIIFNMVDCGTWLTHLYWDDWSTPQWKWRARKSFRTLCEKLESFDPPGGWGSLPSTWTGGV
jgi:hypothetical protein